MTKNKLYKVENVHNARLAEMGFIKGTIFRIIKKVAGMIQIKLKGSDVVIREETLKDVITQLEPGLFQKVVSLSVEDFEYLTSKGIFNTSEMDSAIFAFKRYENSSLHYNGFTKYKPREIGLFDTKISVEEFNKQWIVIVANATITAK